VDSENAEGKHAARLRAADEDGGVADKGRRSFLRRAEGQGEYNAKGTDVNVYLVCNSNDCGKC